MKKLKMRSPDSVQGNIEKIREGFPDCVKEAHDATGSVRLAVDFDLLRQALSDDLIEGERERYRLDWPGKREAMASAHAPIAKTLRPYRNESVDFDATKNLFIEGDNLDALKLLQESYLGKVKMIYIDPPYNTGKDFIYRDKFAVNGSEYQFRNGDRNGDGERMVSNPDSNGRFHSDWLSMIYPRLKTAKNLLRPDGVIFISIDDGEVGNLRNCCDEIFGNGNFVSNVIWEKKYAPSNDAKGFSDNHDHILVYAKNKVEWRPRLLPRTDEQNQRYKNPDNDPRGVWKPGDLSVKTYSEAYDYPIRMPDGRTVNPPHGRCWLMSEKRFKELVEDDRIWFGENGSNVPSIKRFISEVKDGLVPVTIWRYSDVGHNQEGRQEFKRLFDDRGYFDSPKPVRLLERMIHLSGASEEDIVLDFFAGSATTAHAVMQLNAEDGGNRRFIMVQLPEATDEQSEACKAGYKTIADIAKERIRRAGKKILAGKYDPDWNRDVGFRVLKVDSSNMKDVYYRPDETGQENLLDMADNVKEDRTEEDLLFQVLIDSGIDPTLPIHSESVQGKTAFFAGDDEEDILIACFDLDVTEALAENLAQRKPRRVVFRDSGFASDSVRVNVEEIFKQISPDTEVWVI